MDRRALGLMIILAMAGCHSDRSEVSEEESVYMADYEVPGGRWGFIDHRGKLVIPARFDDVGPFSEGLAAVNKNGKWGFIDAGGKFQIEPAYRSAWAFHEGFAHVQTFDGSDIFIDKLGQPLAVTDGSAADDFSEGRAKVKVGNSFGYIDVTGSIVIQPLYSRGWNFENGSAVIEYQEKLGVIGPDGKAILDPDYDQIKKTAGGQVLLCIKNGKAIAYDHVGKELLTIENAKMTDSNGKLIAVRQNNAMFLVSLNDPSFRSSAYRNIIYLEEDLWAAKNEGGYVLLDKDGEQMTEHTYHQVNKFSDGFAAYSKEDYWGYLDRSGNELTGEVFGLAWDYKDGFARAAFKEGIAFIDKDQKLAFYPPAGSLDLRDFSEGLAAVKID